MTGSATPDLMIDELRRALAGRFDLERQLGAGGMGSVYLGRDVTLDRPVAIKVVAPELAAAPTIRERFLREARTVARLRHPNIVAVYAAGEAGGVLYFAMEYVPGESLRALLEREGRFDDARAVAALRDLACALAYAHEHGVVHRDVKPENVMLDAESGRAMLTDFGVAGLIDQARQEGGDGGRMTGLGFVLGSPRYMSPEQAAGERALDGRSDIYSLGLVGYEMFAGAPAVDAPNAASAIVKQLTETPVPVAARNAGVPPLVAAAIERALEKDPARRWATAAEMAGVIDGARGAPPNTNLAAGRATRVTETVRGGAFRRGGRRRALVAAGLAALVVAAGAGWYAVGSRPGVPRGVDPRKSYLVAPFDVLTGDPQLGWLREGSVSMLSTNLAQWTDVAVVDYERSLDLLRELDLENARRVALDDALRMARRAGVWTVVRGQVSSSPDSLLVTARLYDVASGAPVDKQVHRAVPRTADPRPLYDALARDLLKLAGAPANAPLGRLAETTTPSLEAYRAYLDGVRALNAWQLARADSLFRRATQADTAFALAYYKHALTMGWRNVGDTAQLTLVRQAGRHGGRLSPRERELVSAYADLIRALTAKPEGDTLERSAAFVAAQQKYAAIVGRDSTDAEAWYGLGDALWHHRVGDPARNVANHSRALRAFNRTLALDSTFHLAYQHKLDIYRGVSGLASPVVLDGDSLLLLSPAMLRQPEVAARAAEARRRARQLAVREARAWVSADPVPQAYQSLIYAYATTAQFDSAAATAEEAMRQPSSRSPVMPYVLAHLQLRADPPAALRTLRTALGAADPAALTADGGADRFWAILRSAEVAAAAGSVAELGRVVRVAAAAQPTFPGMHVPSASIAEWFGAALEMAMGVPGARSRSVVDSGFVMLDQLPAVVATNFQQSSTAVPYVAYLATRDPRYLAVLRRWSGPLAPPPWELDALEALRLGDTARAASAARQFPSVDSVRATPGGINGLRWSARAEVFTALGDARRALAMYEVLDPKRFTTQGMLDPSWPLYARGFLARGRLYEQLGEREKAATSYARFLELWKEADPVLQPQLREARTGLARLRDARPAAAVRQPAST